MKEVDSEIVSTIISKIYRDTIVTQSNSYFITHTYRASQFKDLVSQEIFHSVIGFLPNSKYRGIPFIMSVVYNKRLEEYEVTVHNPKLKY